MPKEKKLRYLVKAISFIFPIIKTVKSTYNGELEIVWYFGKKRLDSKNTNYSYGSLQEVLDYGIRNTPFCKNSEVLVLGLGGGCIVKSLRENHDYFGHITAVEIDDKIIEIARDEFDVDNSDDLDIYNEDALDFVKRVDIEFGLIIVDLFIDNKVPPIFYKEEFWDLLSDRIADHGFILFNAGVSTETAHTGISGFLHKINDKYHLDKLIHPYHENEIIVLRRNREVGLA